MSTPNHTAPPAGARTSKKLSDYTIAELEEAADFCGLRMHYSEAATQKWLETIHEAAKKRARRVAQR